MGIKLYDGIPVFWDSDIVCDSIYAWNKDGKYFSIKDSIDYNIGYYVWHDRKKRNLHILLLNPMLHGGSIRFKNAGHGIIHRDRGGNSPSDFTFHADDMFRSTLSMAQDKGLVYFDICGRAMGCRKYGDPIYPHSSGAITDFFHGPVMFDGIFPVSMFGFRDILCIIQSIGNDGSSTNADRTAECLGMRIIGPCMEIPEGLPPRCQQDRHEYLGRFYEYFFSIDTYCRTFCIIDHGLLRFFVSCYREGRGFSAMEYMRIHGSSLRDCPMRYFSSPIIWHDNITDTVFEYHEEDLDSMEEYSIKNPWGRNENNIALLVPACASPLFNELESIDMFAYRSFLYHINEDSMESLSDQIKSFFGVDSKDDREGIPLNKKLGVSSPMLREMVRTGSHMADILRKVNRIFSSRADRELISCFNMDESREIVSALRCMGDRGAMCLKELLSVYGGKQCHKYFSYMKEKEMWAAELMEYYDCAYRLGVTGYPWNLEGRMIPDALEHAKRDALLLKNDSVYSLYFKENLDKWSSYCYEDDEYIIIPPKTPMELVTEGAKLHNCVGNYILDAAYGATVILFVRRKDYPETPFYTLEVKDGVFVQCRGFGNKRMDDMLQRFIERFCADKSISVDTSCMGTSVSGPQLV